MESFTLTMEVLPPLYALKGVLGESYAILGVAYSFYAILGVAREVLRHSCVSHTPFTPSRGVTPFLYVDQAFI